MFSVSEFSPTLGLERGASALWIGASSFEERCWGSLETLAEAGIRVPRALRLDYDSRTSEEDEAQHRRAVNREHQGNVLRQLGCDDLVAIAVGAMTTSAFLGKLSDAAVVGRNLDAIVIDLSSMTRLHVISLATILPHIAVGQRVVLGYTQPENYPRMAERRSDWEGFNRVVIAPLAPGASLRAESRARGVIILSHESQRLLVALSEFEPNGGSIVKPQTGRRPDFAAVAANRNRMLLRRLIDIGDWKSQAMPFGDGYGVAQAVVEQAEIAKANDAPLMLYPFGPKPLIAAAGLAASQAYPEAAWVVYPVPSFYDPLATEGVAETCWAEVTPSLPDSPSENSGYERVESSV